jgi:hypothetical protein
MVEARINDPTAIDRDSIAAILDSGRTPTVQFSRPCYTPALLDQVNQLCIEFGDRLEIRFYGHYANDFSAAALAPLRDVRWLSLFGLTSIADSDCLARLPSLTRFSFGVQEFDDPAFLEKLDLTRITNLTLSANAKRNLDLAALGNAATLENLSLQGHSKNIEAITGLPALHSVSLSGFPNTRDLAFLNRLAPLRCVRVFFGSRASIRELLHPGLETLEILRVRNLEDIGPLARFPRLCELQIEDQLQLRSIDVSGTQLRKLQLLNCKTLETIEGLASLGELVECRLGRTKLDLESIAKSVWPETLEVLAH